MRKGPVYSDFPLAKRLRRVGAERGRFSVHGALQKRAQINRCATSVTLADHRGYIQKRTETRQAAD